MAIINYLAGVCTLLVFDWGIYDMYNKSFFIIASSCLSLCSETALASEAASEVANNLPIEEVVVTGTRRTARSAADTPAPVDVISGADFRNQGDGDLSNLLRTVVPSYNVNAQPISDAATLVRPANLRGLAPDQTLVLINGKRRHRAAVIAFLGGGLADGAQGPDISVIPAIALKKVEVLRDGAAAQYGSDAIAGVMNFVLRDDNEGGSLEAKWGSTYAGDGDNYQIAANLGMPVTERGFLNFSAEWREQKPTVRSVQHDAADELIAAGNTAVRQPYVQIWGQPEVRDDIKAFFNFELETNDSSEFYAFGNYAEREVEGGFYYRNPNTRTGVNFQEVSLRDPLTGATISDASDLDADGNITETTLGARLVGDMTPIDGVNCVGGYNFNEGEATTGLITDPIIIGSAEEAAQVAAIAADDNCFLFNEMFPGGFTPQFGGRLEDVAIAAGYRGELDFGLSYDLSYNFGQNRGDFFIYNTVNPSLGSETPTSFELGAYVQQEQNVNADFSYPVEFDFLYSPLNFAFGFEWREEQFSAEEGDLESYTSGVLANSINLINLDGETVNVSQGFGVGSNGFNGFGPQVAGTWNRTNVALYGDVEADITDRLVLGAALRWEDFSDFGSTTNFKITSLYKVSDTFRMRGSVSTGFRAPTVGQREVINVSTVFENIDGQFLLVQRGTIPPTNPVAASFGAEALSPEKSGAFTLGIATNLGDLSLTADYFNIKVSDRITQSATINLSSEDRANLLASGVTFAADLAAFRFFVNDFDTRTQGVDIVATLPLTITEAGESQISFAGNYTKTSVIKFNPETLNATRIRQLEENLPRVRMNATFTHNEDRFRFLSRVNFYGKYWEAHLDSSDLPIDAKAEFTLDIELGYAMGEGLTASIGANNLFDNYPTENTHGSATSGAKYPPTSPMGFNGGSYYARLRFDF
jgi:iron complex outermembrane receptor protein